MKTRRGGKTRYRAARYTRLKRPAGSQGFRKRARILTIKPGADPRLKEVFASIGVPEPTPFEPDRFQLEALEAIERGDCLVTR